MYEKAIVILGVLLTCAAGLNAADLILNEYNAVGPNQYLEDGAADTYWGRVQGNGGDWFELVVITDHLDMSNWDLVISDDTGGADEYVEVLALTNDPIWFNLRSGTIITVSEDLPDDVSYDPANGDWWINVQASNDADGTYITASNFRVSDANWQLTIKDDAGVVVFGPAGEGIQPATGVIAQEVCKLEEDPSASITPSSNYRDGQSSTFGSANIWQGGAHSQDFSDLRDVLEECTSDAECDDGVGCTNDACAEGTCVFTPNDANCDDGLYCNGAETCEALLDCQAGTAVDCGDGVGCTDDSCNEATDSCDYVPNDGHCDDGWYCTGAETCDLNGDCQPGTDPCAGRLCDPDAEECHDQGCASDGDCDDALYCNGLETCADGSCQAGTHVDCDDGLNCTDDSCNEDTDSCDNTPRNADCDNGLFCDGAEICDPLLGCQPGSDPCPDQTCDEQAGLCVDCLSNDDCDDGEYCNGDETCQAGVCTDGERPCADLDHCDEVNDECVPCLGDAECDDDGDGVVNSLDECADTPAGAKVDDTGCTITLPEEPAGAELPTSGNGDDGNIEAPPSNGQDVGGSASGSDNGDGNTDASPGNGGHAGGSASGGGSGSCGVIGLVNLAFIFAGLVAMRLARPSGGSRRTGTSAG